MKYDTNAIPAVVLAGGINRIVLFKGYRPGFKALLSFRGKPLIQYTLNALRNTDRINRICIVGPDPDIRSAVSDCAAYEYVQAGETLVQNIQKGLAHFRDSTAVLVIPSDLPLATSKAIGDFLYACSRIGPARDTAICWSMVPENSFTGAYSQVKKGFNRFRDVSVCHGNLLLAAPALLGNKRFTSRMDRIYNARKSTIRAALAVGPLTGLSYLIGVHLLRILTIAQFARIASEGFGVELVPVLLKDPDIAVDIDEARDYRFIMEELDRREKERDAVLHRRAA
jgi:GTP:adenosylcobinamide-phosphate guanylyltransferase